MNQIVSLNTTAALTMSSREIAELTDKNHADVLRDIRVMFDQLGGVGSRFAGYYTAANGKRNPCFALPKRETLILVSGYSVELRARIIDRWMELEEQHAKTHANFFTSDPFTCKRRFASLIKGLPTKYLRVIRYLKNNDFICLDERSSRESNSIVLAGTLHFNLSWNLQMSIQLAAFGHRVEIVNRLPHAFYVFTKNHEFAWSRKEWFERPSGKWRHWVIEKANGTGPQNIDTLQPEIREQGESLSGATAG